MTEHKYTNKLINEKSPYLLQHAHNPVNWYPWSEEAFKKAKMEDKPIFLSIGYSTCHWCHVMERESFEDTEVAGLLNTYFVAIKVDREERPDIDNIYMTVCQMLTGHGGWPLTILMTPDKKPFYGGTYFPKNDRAGLPGILTLLKRVHTAWSEGRDTLLESAERILGAVNQYQSTPSDFDAGEIIREAYADFKNDFDDVFGGFSNAPKFPSPHNLYFLLRYWYVYKDAHALEMVEKTLDSMYRGGIFDHIGWGFSRYSTDRKWLVPHFEKMLYDNALLAIAYLEAYQATKKDDYRETARQILEYVLRDMTSTEGGFYSAEDADSEGVEGKFYLWTPEEVKAVLGERNGEWYCKKFGISERGNFEGYSIPNLIRNAANSKIDGTVSGFPEDCRKKLFDYREKRVHPYKDDKVLTAWNGLMIAAMALGGRVLCDIKYTEAAEKAVCFIYSFLIRGDGRLMARYRDGDSAYLGYVDDYAFLIWGLIELYETSYKHEYLQKALKLNDDLLKLFWDEENGGLFIYGKDGEQLISRPKEIYDGAMPSGNSVAAFNFLRLARLSGRFELEDKARQLFKTFGGLVTRFPRGYSFFMIALLYTQAPSREVILVGNTKSNDIDNMVQIIHEDFRPFTVSMFHFDDNDYKAIKGRPTAYVCENFTCKAPVTDPNEFRSMLS